MAIHHEYGESIVCMTCGNTDLKITHSPMGIAYCSCNRCGRKFVVQTSGEDFLDKYLAARAQFFTALETSDFGKDSVARMKRELERLVGSYAVLAEIDSIYYWYKIIILTENFTDYSRLKQAEKEYLNIPQDECYFISGEDIVRDQKYKNQYDAYMSHLEEERSKAVAKKRRKKKAAIGAVIAVLLAAVIGAGAFAFVYDPTLADSESGITVYTDNSSFGIIDKFGVKLKAGKLAESDTGYSDVSATMKEITVKYVPYSIAFSKGSEVFKLDKGAEVDMRLPSEFVAERIRLYALSEDLKQASEVKTVLSEDGKSLKFKLEKSGVYVISEAPCEVSFDTATDQGIGVTLVAYGSKLSDRAVARTGYTFDGWFVGNEKFDFSAQVNKDITLTAHWTPKTYTVSYYIDGAVAKTLQVTYDENVELYDPERVGYTHKWYIDGSDNELTDGIWTRDSDVKVDCRFTAIASEVTFDNDSVTENSTLEVVYDEPRKDVKVLERKGYVFDGYYTERDGKGTKVYGADGKGSGVWQQTENSTLYAHWTKDSAYTDYTYIESAADMSKVRATPSGKFLLTKSLDLNGASWTPLPVFTGVFDGGHNAIYNYTIELGVEESGSTHSWFGLFAKIEGTVKNLQVGKEGYVTSIKYSAWDRRAIAGLLVGEVHEAGVVENCRAIECSVDVSSLVNKSDYRNWVWSVMAGALAGSVESGGTLRGCYVEGGIVLCTAQAQFNKIDASPWAGGLVGFASQASVLDCLVKNTKVTAHGIRLGGGALTADNAQPRAGGLIGKAENKTNIERCIVYGNTVEATAEGNAEKHWGSMIGETSDTLSKSLFGVATELQCSGTDRDYENYRTLAVDSYADLIATDPSFDNGYWTSVDGEIALSFDKTDSAA